MLWHCVILPCAFTMSLSANESYSHLTDVSRCKKRTKELVMLHCVTSLFEGGSRKAERNSQLKLIVRSQYFVNFLQSTVCVLRYRLHLVLQLSKDIVSPRQFNILFMSELLSLRSICRFAFFIVK